MKYKKQIVGKNVRIGYVLVHGVLSLVMILLTIGNYFDLYPNKFKIINDTNI